MGDLRGRRLIVNKYKQTQRAARFLKGCWESFYLGVDAAVWQSQVGAVLVTDRAHDDVSGLADFLTGQQHLEKCVNCNTNEFFHQLWKDLNKCCREASTYDLKQIRGSLGTRFSPNLNKRRYVYLTWQCSTVKTPYRNTKRPTRAAGNSIPVYQPSQAKYRPIFSPKYLLKQQQHPKGSGPEKSSSLLLLCVTMFGF